MQWVVCKSVNTMMIIALRDSIKFYEVETSTAATIYAYMI